MIEEFPYALLEKTWKIMRKSISTFLKQFQYFTTIPVLLMIPFSASILVSSQIPLGLFYFPSTTSNLLLTNKSYFSTQTLFASILILPFYLTSLLLSKACVIQALKENHSNISSLYSLYKPLLITQLFNMVLSLSINIVSISLVSITFRSLDSLGFLNKILRTICVLVFYAVVTNTTVLCNLCLAVAGLENCNAYKAMHKAYLLRKGSNNSIAMCLALPTNLSLASIQALFCLRVLVRDRISVSLAFEGILIAYLYSIIVVVDTISCCLFLKTCRLDSPLGSPNGFCNKI